MSEPNEWPSINGDPESYPTNPAFIFAGAILAVIGAILLTIIEWIGGQPL